jgi:NAD(P)-dependent dehydrogenase (short-subunit alcohol dehydrogenase family)
MDFNLKNKQIIVTAAGNGIGRAACIALHKEGAKLIAVDHNKSALNKLKSKLKTRIIIKKIDCTSSDEIKINLKDIKKLDVLINCVGYVPQGTILECTKAEWEHTLNTNITSVFLMTKFLLPIMNKAKSGSIVNISSVVSSIKGVARRYAYSGTKAAIIGLTKSLAFDFAKQNIRCNVICPGTVNTPSWRERVITSGNPKQKEKDFISRQLIGRVGTPEEIADLIIFLSSDRSSFVTGSVYNIDGGMSL